MIKNRAVPLGVLSGLVIIGGIIFAVLVGVAFNQIKDKISSNSAYNSVSSAVDFPFWVSGFMYIIPGMLSLGAALVQNKCTYIVALVFDILFVIGMASVIAILGLTTYVAIVSCSDRYFNYIRCDYSSPQAIFIGIFVVGAMSWIFLFIAFIVCCYYTCCAKETISAPGVIVQSGPQINVSVSQNTQQQQNSQAYPTPMNMGPAYGAPQYGQNGYGAPQYGQNGYGAPQYGQNGYGAPNGQNGYGAPNGQIGYGAPNGQNSYGAPNGQNGYGAPNGQIGYGAPDGQNSYGAPNGQNGYGAPNGQIAYGAPNGQNSFGAPNEQNGPGALNGQNAHSGHQQNTPSTDVKSPADVHLQDITKNNN